MTGVGRPLGFQSAGRGTAAEVRARVAALMECPSCGQHRMTLRQIASQAGIGSTALFLFLRGDTNGSYTVGALTRWLDAR